MADENNKTEEPTARKLEKTREEGQFARSQELSVALLTIAVAVLIFIIGSTIASYLLGIFEESFSFDSGVIRNQNLLSEKFADLMLSSLLSISPIFITTLLLAIGAAFIVGGVGFSVKGFMPKLSKLSLISGLGRIFGKRSLSEVIKGLLKLALIGSVSGIVIYSYSSELFSLSLKDTHLAPQEGIEILGIGFLLMSLSLLIIASLDVPLQLYLFKEKLKMSIQEIRDEMKETEGSPEVRQRIRAKQREIAMAKMLEAVPSADVIITNPEHFSVALIYQPESNEAPRVVAKGADLIAKRIREIAAEAGVHIFEEPKLARALFFTANVGDEIPRKLFEAVAEVIAFVFKMNAFSSKGKIPKKPEITVPQELQFDENGNNL